MCKECFKSQVTGCVCPSVFHIYSEPQEAASCGEPVITKSRHLNLQSASTFQSVPMKRSSDCPVG